MLKFVKNIFKMKDPIVNISTGKLRGQTSTSINNNNFYYFKGIPYAKPPIGNLRFKAPLPAEPWTGTRDATREGKACVQRVPFINKIQGDEDCLTLNVYTHKLPENEDPKKPVMVWIHGGGFSSGSGGTETYGPEFLMTEDIVLVSINYRLGVLGFLSLEDPDLNVPGNAGLKDIVMALKWVKENIVHFCGDPNNVTIFGESAGGAAAHYLMLSPMAQGLFHKAILQSGCALNVWATGKRSGVDLGKILGLQTTDERKILGKLESLPVKELFLASEKLRDSFNASILRPLGPVVEKKSKGAFLSEHPIDIIKSGKYNDVPIIIGYTNREGMLSEVFQKPKPFRPLRDFEKAIPHFLKLQPGSDISKTVAREIKEFYYGDEEPTSHNKDAFYLLQTDNFFLRELVTTIKLHRETSSRPIFFYRMSVETDLNMMKNVSGIGEPGVCHADDLGYLFKNLLTPEMQPGSDEEIAMKRFVKLWTNFAKYGNPNGEKKDPLIDVEWKSVSRNEIHFLDIGKKLTSGVNPEAERMSFWATILKINSNSKL